MNPFISSNKRLAAFCLLILGACVYGVAQAQTQPWDTNVLNWGAVTQCTTGEPVSACPVTGYRVETAATATGTFTLAGATASAVTTFSHTGVTAGQHCYRVIALSSPANSDPSNVVCKTNVKPVGPPNPPVLTIAALSGLNIPLDSLDGFKRTPVFSITANGPGVLLGFCKLGTPSISDTVFVYKDQAYCKPLEFHPRTGAANIAWVKDVTAAQKQNAAASCA